MNIISIITCTYNSKKFIERLYNSLAKQTDRYFEWIIVDDFSDDNTIEIVSKFKPPGFGGIKVFRMPFNSGGGVASCVGVLKSQGDFLSIIDHDDEIVPEAIYKMREKSLKISKIKDIAGILFRSIQNNKNMISSLKENETFKVSYFINNEKKSVDGVWVFKRDIAKHYYSKIDASKKVLSSVVLLKISQKYSFKFAGGEPILIYHRDNSESQSKDIRISNHMIYCLSQILNYHDKYYYSRPIKWIRYTIGLIHFSIIFYGTPFSLIRLVSRQSTKFWLICLIPLGFMAHFFKKRGRVVKYKEINAIEIIDKIQEIKFIKS